MSTTFLTTTDIIYSAQDQYVLEASYLQNAKPDKAERAAIVTQVELSEKEVQVRSTTAQVARAQ